MTLGETARGAINRAGTGETFWRHESPQQPLLVVKEGDERHLRLAEVLPPGTGPAGDTHARVLNKKTSTLNALSPTPLVTRAARDETGPGPVLPVWIERDPLARRFATAFSRGEVDRWLWRSFRITLKLENGRSHSGLWASPTPDREPCHDTTKARSRRAHT